MQRIGVPAAAASEATAVASAAPRRSHIMSRADEYAVIRSDLRRLLMILACEAVVLVAATIILR
jgi:hypothetical protein